MRSVCLSLLAGLPFATPSLAQETKNAEDTPPVIIVTGDGLADAPSVGAYSTREIERDLIVRSPSGRIEDVLASVAGFQQYRRSDSRSSNPTAQGATLRALGGNATSRALVLLDGVPLADPFFGYIPFSAIAPERLTRIRVTQGGGSGPFGAGALAGTIELESAGPGDLPPLSASALANDRGANETTALMAQSLGDGFAFASVRWDRGPGFYTSPPSQRVPASARSAFDSLSASLRGVAPLAGDIELQASALVFGDHRTLRFDGADSSSSGADASLRLVTKGRWQVDALAYLQMRDFSNVVISSSRFVRVLDQRSTPSTGLGGKIEVRPPVPSSHVLRLGIDIRRAAGSLREDAYSAITGVVTERRRAQGSSEDLGLFAEDDWKLGPLLVTGGLRLDRTRIGDGAYAALDPAGTPRERNDFNGRSEWAVSWRAGARYAANDLLALRGAAYRGFRVPTLNELLRPFVVFPVVTLANPELENETMTGFEIGADLTLRPKAEFSLTAFDNRVNGAIANVTLAPGLRQRQNLPAIESRGIELGARFALGTFDFDGTLAYTDASTVGAGASAGLDGKRPAQSPRFAAAATASWRPSSGEILSVTLRHVGAQFESDLETDRLPPATTVGAFIEKPLRGRLSLVLRGENLLAETIVTRNSDGSIDLGVPRTIWAGLRYGL